MTLLIDSHAHLCDKAFENEIDQILESAKNHSVGQIVNICTDLETLEKGIALARSYPWIHLAASTTPHDVEKEGEIVFEKIAESARKGLLKAIGETGLDYYYEHSNRKVQQTFFKRYLSLANECNLPVVIHCRDAFSDFFDIIDTHFHERNLPCPGVLHCFTGTSEDAKELVKRGWMISMSGIVTFKKSVDLQEIAKSIPLENLLIETDAPYLAPQKNRGKRNEPAFLYETAQFLSHLRGVAFEELANATTANAKKLFRI